MSSRAHAAALRRSRHADLLLTLFRVRKVSVPIYSLSCAILVQYGRGPLGAIANRLVIARPLARIFDFRAAQLGMFSSRLRDSRA